MLSMYGEVAVTPKEKAEFESVKAAIASGKKRINPKIPTDPFTFSFHHRGGGKECVPTARITNV